MYHDSKTSASSILIANKLAISALLLACLQPPSVLATDWPNWRGPNRDGTTATARNLPDTWGPDRNIKWKQELPAWSGSSPVVWGDRIFLNCPSKEEAQPPAQPTAESAGRGRPQRTTAVSGPGGQEILLLCLDRATGRELWRRQYDRGNEIRNKHNHSSPTPVTDGKHVWVMSGNGKIACFDLNGNQQWTFDVPATYGKIGTNFGYGSSPLLLDGRLILQVLHGMKTDDPSYVFALQAETGKVLWHVERPTDAVHESPDSYSTPAVLETGGKTQVVILGGDYLTGHDPASGTELWRAEGMNPRKTRNYRTIASSLVKDGMIFAPTRVTPLLAFRAGGSGDISKSQLAWSWESRGAPDVPTPVSDGPRFYMADDAGQITCLDAKTGALIYGPEETGIGRVSSSPIIADGKIYLTSETAETAVIEAGPRFRLIAKNPLDNSYTLSSPAIAGSEIFIRTATHLYCIAK